MKKNILIALFASALVSSAYASNQNEQPHHDDQCDGHECRPKTKEVCFNLYCSYEVEGPRDHELKSCTAASTFSKKVTLEGAEVPETLDGNLEVKCDGQTWVGRADIFTGLLGTRVQGKTGPDPAIFLPRGALTASCGPQTQGHYTESSIEINDDGKFSRSRGKCFVWVTEQDHHN